MPDAKNNAKMTGDTHLPDVESEFDVEEADAHGAGTGGKADDRSPAAGRKRKKADLRKDGEAEDHSAPASGAGTKPAGR